MKNWEIDAFAELFVAFDQVIQLILQQLLELIHSLWVFLEIVFDSIVEQHIVQVKERFRSTENAACQRYQHIFLIIVT